MSNLTEYDVQNIRRYIDSFSKKAISVKKLLDTDFDNKLYRAQNNLSSYTKQEEAATKSANKTISQVWGSGWSNRNNINDFLKQKGEKCAEEIEKAFDQYSSEIRSIVGSLPQIGEYSSQRIHFNSTEYTGDIEITDEFGTTLSAESDTEDRIISNENESGNLIFYSNESIRRDDSGYNTDENLKTTTHIPTDDITPVATLSDTFTTDNAMTVLSIGTLSGLNMRKLICSNVVEIQANAFKSLPNLELIVLSEAIKTININAFRGLENKCIIAFVGTKERAEARLSSTEGLKNRRVIFDYHDGDELNEAITAYNPSSTESSEKSKRIVIRKNTPLDNDSIKEVFLARNAKYELTMDELNEGIQNSGTTVNKEEILLEALRIKRLRDLKDNSFWNYAKTIQYMIQLCESLGRTEEELSLIFALFYLDSSGYRMVNGKYNPYKQEPYMMYYHPKMQMQNLQKIQEDKHFSNDYLETAYANSPYVLELTKAIKDGYYSLETSIKMMLTAMEDPFTIFYPGQTKFKRIN